MPQGSIICIHAISYAIVYVQQVKIKVQKHLRLYVQALLTLHTYSRKGCLMS